MNINSIGSYQSVPPYSKNNTVQSESTNTFASIVEKAEKNGQHPNSITKKPSNLYEELSNKYDVRNATFEDIIKISDALYEAGEISFDDHMILTFDYGHATNDIKANSPGYNVPANFDMYETKADSNGRRNWIEEFGARASKDLKFNNLIAHQSKMKVLTILERLAR